LDLEELRRVYARQMLALANASADKRLENAFAAVPRENFLGEGTWHIMTPWSPYALIEDRDSVLIYQDVVVALDEARGVNNGSPALHAYWLHATALRSGESVAHIGAGAGYYTAILAELVGDTGHVTAVEYDGGRAAAAKENLKGRRNVEVVQADGRNWPQTPVDVVYVNFAASCPAAAWIESLAIGGRLIFPLGVPREGPGIRHGLNALALMIERRPSGYAARPLRPVSIVFAEGAEGLSDELVRALQALLELGGWEEIRSLVWNEAVDEASCWFKGDGWALSYDEPSS
jgi:protein-L-isoaspartate(D-aspartate) O-methyltransferase